MGDQMRVVIYGILLMLTVTAAKAEEDMMSTSFMLPYCKMSTGEMTLTETNSYGGGKCMGAIQALKAAILAYHPTGLNCTDIPGDVTDGELLRVFTKYADQHPERTNSPFITLMIDALHATWPCKH
jgi:hypothetical protein